MIAVSVSTTAADDALSNELYNQVAPADAFSNEHAAVFKASMVDADDFLVRDDEAAVGSAFVAIRPARPHVAFALIAVLEPHRRRGAGDALYATVSDWARERALNAIETFVDEDDAPGLAFAEKRGFRPIKRYERMALDLKNTAPPDVAPPEGIEITTLAERPELLASLYDIDVEASPDEPGNEDEVVESFEDWLERERREDRDSDPTFVALADGDAIAYAKLAFTAARPGVMRHQFTAVKRAWRGRGIAAALKRAQVGWAKDAGYERLVTQNEERNAPILRINERLGYRPAAARVLMLGPPVSGGA